MLKIRPYVPSDANAIVTWPETEFDFRQFSGTRYDHFPITGDELDAYYRENPNLWPFVAFDEGGFVGHFVLSMPEGSDTAGYHFAIVDACRRGQGCGTKMTRCAVRFAFEFLGAQAVTLKVFDNNERARRCYEAAGFSAVPLGRELSFPLMGEQWGCLVMEQRKPAGAQ